MRPEAQKSAGRRFQRRPRDDDRRRSSNFESSICICVCYLLFVCCVVAENDEAFVGVNIGTQVTDMPAPTQVVALLKSQNINHIRLYDADRGMLTALRKTGIEVVISVPNNQILAIGQSNQTAANWVNKNVVAYLPDTNITGICVGSEVLTTLPNAALVLVPAMRFLYSALVAANLDKQVKISSAQSSDIILDAFPPSQAFFNTSLKSILKPMLGFLQSTDSYFMINVYPYYVYMQGNGVVGLDYALFRPLPANKEAVDTNTMLHYTNVFDAMVDAAYFAMADLNFTNIPVFVSESGWPSKGDSNEPDATVENANTYNSNLIKHVLKNSGTPKHPGIPVSTYIYELFNEDQRPGPTSEKNWGLFNSDKTPVYTLHLTDAGVVLANDTTNNTYCIALDGVDEKLLQAALDWACGPGQVNCSAIEEGQQCYYPDTVRDHASYAFDSYYHMSGMAPKSCDFQGVATVTTTDPSHGSCIFPGSGSVNGSGMVSTNGTIADSSLNSTSSSGSGSSRRDSQLLSLSSYYYSICYLLLISLPIALLNGQ
eukprot:TRINITY_DN4699_c0_g1_i1.p1 TRINITY_DN4699_c0_g1~~TRINITY_DN4699_c0_g1_i1.p1  ORF type:complete len:542 (-),score=25.94 TRINITY_DN4699_c0_g1_i1:417-2042(-)